MHHELFNKPWLLNQQAHASLKAAIRAGKNLSEEETTPPLKSEIRADVAIIPLEGILTKNRSFSSPWASASSMREIGASFTAAMKDTAVKGIILAIDSPGGTVDGTQELVDRISAARGKKPIIAIGDGTMTSAAYWIASAADKVYIANDTTSVGSIGVVATHVDVSEQDKQFGETWTEITAGAYKRIASSHAPLTAEGRDYIQQQVDYIYSVFVQSVVQLRKTPVEKLLPSADGQIFVGKQAISAGLADGLATVAQVVASIINPGTHAIKPKIIEGFEDVVHRLSQKMKPAEAIVKAANDFPALHADYLDRCRHNQPTKNLRRA